MIQYLILTTIVSAIIYAIFYLNYVFIVELIDLEDKDPYRFARLSNSKIKAIHKTDPNLSYYITDWEWLRIKEINRLNSLSK